MRDIELTGKLKALHWEIWTLLSNNGAGKPSSAPIVAEFVGKTEPENNSQREALLELCTTLEPACSLIKLKGEEDCSFCPLHFEDGQGCFTAAFKKWRESEGTAKRIFASKIKNSWR